MENMKLYPEVLAPGYLRNGWLDSDEKLIGMILELSSSEKFEVTYGSCST